MSDNISNINQHKIIYDEIKHVKYAKRIELNNKCIQDFDTQIAYDKDNNEITIKEYKENLDKTHKRKRIYCDKGHILTFQNCKTRKCYFRHKNSNDISYDMTKWHKSWQNNFTETEIKFNKINEKQITNRRADVLIREHKTILELQHSRIDKIEIDNRKHDYNLHGHQIIWLLDGNNNRIHINNINISSEINRTILEFNESWQYESFLSYNIIFINVGEHIYKVYPEHIKSNMIDVEILYTKDEFIELIKNNDKKLNEIKIPNQCTMYIKQQGAGNGKTYGIIQMLESKEFEYHDSFIIVTKQHSAKTVIYQEFIDQVNKGFLEYITDIKGITPNNKKDKFNNKKYIITYTNTKTLKKCKIVIATIDSLMYSLGNKEDISNINKFNSLVNSIINDFVTEKINIGGISTLNKKICLICDETQDLSENYAKAIYKIMRNWCIDSYIVGDKLQSLMHVNNGFTYLLNNDLSYINKIKEVSTNICRRFNNKELIDFVNAMIYFDKYNLPKISTLHQIITEEKSLIIFEGKNIYSSSNEEIINKEVDEILRWYKYEVENNNKQPNDFLFVTLFTSYNPLCDALELAINEYWNKKNNNKEKYIKYCIFHKSDEGTSINLEESINATRIVSIHSAKGDGRDIVFAINISESGLLKFSKEHNLIYESLLHVALTRQKKKLYFRLVNNGDDIHKRIQLANKELNINIQNKLEITKNLKYENIINEFKNDYDYTIIKSTTDKLNFNNEEANNIINTKPIIEMNHHLLRYLSMKTHFMIKTLIHQNNNLDSQEVKEIKKQYQQKCETISKYIIKKTESWDVHYDILKSDLKKTYISVLEMSNGDENKYICECIINIMKEIKNKLINLLVNMDGNYNLCPIECIIFNYMLDFEYGIYSRVTMMDLHNMVDTYCKCFNHDFKGHGECLCKKIFNNNEINNNNLFQRNLIDHHEKISNIDNIYKDFLENKKISWLVNHSLFFNGKNKDYSIYKQNNIIGYDNENIYLIYLKPDFNQLNEEEIKFNSLFDAFLINSINDINDEDNNTDIKEIKKYGNKKIKVCVFSLNIDYYIEYDWTDIIKESYNNILNLLTIKIIEQYKIQIKSYLYMLQNSKIDDPKKFITDFVNKFKNNKKSKIAPFIINILESILKEINRGSNQEKKLEIFIKYKNEDNFNELAHYEIEYSVKQFMGVD
jgi:hypothetical protein